MKPVPLLILSIFFAESSLSLSSTGRKFVHEPVKGVAIQVFESTSSEV